MPSLRVTLQAFSEVLGTTDNSTFLIVCMMDLHGQEEVVEIRVFNTGQSALDFFHEMDRPQSTQVIVGLQLAIAPNLNNTGQWEVEPVLDFKRISAILKGDESDLYGYETLSGRTFSDNLKIPDEQVISARSIYKASNTEAEDLELQAYQLWLAKILVQLINEAYSLKKAGVFFSG
ncbi:hypothetical protein H8F21_02590 [Pseudomonas sp. P66]|uniref:DUF1833 domain-containing protein n=1 Tax=Pseudomonas arcuscaelestis TaxID=2710591 RepID=A0ABS2BS36_9PSED|nr:hypothetical protein [Pseudomonas arcuscaelestis]MBM5456452.1 hypothetical protein [Pseudomonas arcuscaelestis]